MVDILLGIVGLIPVYFLVSDDLPLDILMVQVYCAVFVLGAIITGSLIKSIFDL